MTYTFSNDDADVDRGRVHAWLSDQSYWAKGRERAVQDAPNRYLVRLRQS